MVVDDAKRVRGDQRLLGCPSTAPSGSVAARLRDARGRSRGFNGSYHSNDVSSVVGVAPSDARHESRARRSRGGEVLARAVYGTIPKIFERRRSSHRRLLPAAVGARFFSVSTRASVWGGPSSQSSRLLWSGVSIWWSSGSLGRLGLPLKRRSSTTSSSGGGTPQVDIGSSWPRVASSRGYRGSATPNRLHLLASKAAADEG